MRVSIQTQSGARAGGATADGSAALPQTSSANESGDSSSWVWPNAAGTHQESLMRTGGRDNGVVHWEAGSSEGSFSFVRVSGHGGATGAVQDGGPQVARRGSGKNDLPMANQGNALGSSECGTMPGEVIASSGRMSAVEVDAGTVATCAFSATSVSYERGETSGALSNGSELEGSVTVQSLAAATPAAVSPREQWSSGMQHPCQGSTPLFPPLPFADAFGEDVDG